MADDLHLYSRAKDFVTKIPEIGSWFPWFHFLGQPIDELIVLLVFWEKAPQSSFEKHPPSSSAPALLLESHHHFSVNSFQNLSIQLSPLLSIAKDCANHNFLVKCGFPCRWLDNRDVKIKCDEKTLVSSNLMDDEAIEELIPISTVWKLSLCNSTGWTMQLNKVNYATQQGELCNSTGCLQFSQFCKITDLQRIQKSGWLPPPSWSLSSQEWLLTTLKPCKTGFTTSSPTWKETSFWSTSQTTPAHIDVGPTPAASTSAKPKASQKDSQSNKNRCEYWWKKS